MDTLKLGSKVGHLLAKREAIDMTPIYYFLLTEDIGKGRTIRWDRAEMIITVEDLANNA